MEQQITSLLPVEHYSFAFNFKEDWRELEPIYRAIPAIVFLICAYVRFKHLRAHGLGNKYYFSKYLLHKNIL